LKEHIAKQETSVKHADRGAIGLQNLSFYGKEGGDARQQFSSNRVARRGQCTKVDVYCAKGIIRSEGILK
jgi:hypothetical protein